ncbi:MAG: hypothetical protein SGJ27_07250 [Candidatus Melainabacteria bacterium]|nr:hypothetical protein [Candidatus Melainabacteria bacterium]
MRASPSVGIPPGLRANGILVRTQMVIGALGESISHLLERLDRSSAEDGNCLSGSII